MSDQILTQEEIDALLTAMDNGEVDLAEEKQETEVLAYNLTSQSKMLGDQFHALEEVYDKLAGLMSATFSALLQKSIEVEFASSEMVKYSDCISAFSNPTSFSMFTMEPLIGSAMLSIEPRLVYSLIDCMFGGGGKPTERMREFTLIEQRMMRKFTLELLTNLEAAWNIVEPIQVVLKRSETKPEFVHLASPNEIIVVIVFSVRSQEFTGNLHICIPYLMLEPIKEKLSAKYLRQKELEHNWSEQLETLLQEIPVTLVAELGISIRSVRNLLDLQIDDVIQLNTGPEDLVTLTVDNIPKFNGFPGIIKGNRAVEIAALQRNKGGEN